MMTKEAYMALFEKCATGQCSPEEMRLLEVYRDAFDWDKRPWDEVAMGPETETKARIKKRLMTAVEGDRQKRPIMMYGWLRYVAAAAVVIAVAITFVMYRQTDQERESAKRKEVILPGSNRALLTLEDGSQIVLDEAKDGQLAERGNVSIVKAADGQLTYYQREDSPTQGQANTVHSVSTPRGGQYQLALADGTKVWLNAASSIRFPAEFSGHERVVEISGEAYFEIAKDPNKPFIVKGNGQQVIVLGTRFNVSAYPDDYTIQTALLQGSVRVTIANTDYALQPGQRTVFDKRKQGVTRERFDPEVVLAWQRGDFMFDGEPVEQVMRKIGRWYDVEIVYKGSMQGKLFTGTVSRYEQVNDVLDMLAQTGTVRFSVEGRRITVME